MKKLALVSALIVAVSGTALAVETTTAAAAPAPQSAQMQSRGGFNDGSNPQAQQLQQGKRDVQAKTGRHHKDGKKRDAAKRGNFIDTNAPITSVNSVKDLKDKDRLVLEGFIEKQVGKKDYVFRDDSGNIELEISRRAWHGQEITPNDKVKLFGEVDKSWSKTEVEIFHVAKVQ